MQDGYKNLDDLDPKALLTNAADTTPGQAPEVPGYQLGDAIGEGGMGTVYRATQESLDREVALKVLRSTLQKIPGFYDRLDREAKSMAKLNHPQIVGVYDFILLDSGGAAIVMEYPKGGNLRQWLNSQKSVSIEKALAFFQAIASAVKTAHQAGIIHRDLKPENILLTTDHEVKVADFGLALPIQEEVSRLTRSGTSLGTLGYMAPEQQEGKQADERSDIYSLGVILYELLIGEPPKGSFDPPSVVNKEIPQPISDAVRKAMRANPEERFTSIQEFVDAIGSSTNHSRRKWLYGAAAVAGLSAIGYYTLKPEETSEWSSLLEDLNLQANTVSGDWTELSPNQGIAGSASDEKPVSLLTLRTTMPARYQIKTTFTRKRPGHSFAIFFRTENGMGSCELDSWEVDLCGVQALDYIDLRSAEHFQTDLEVDRQYELLFTCEPNQFRISIDGEEKIVYSDVIKKPLSVPAAWFIDDVFFPETTALGLGIYNTQFEIHTMDWRVY